MGKASLLCVCMCWRLCPGMLTVYIVHLSVPNANPNTCSQCQPSVQGSTSKNVQLHFRCNQECMSPFAKTEIDSPRKKQKISAQSVSPQNRNIFPAKITKGNYLPAKILHARCLPVKTESESPQILQKSTPRENTKNLRAKCLPAKMKIYSPRKLPKGSMCRRKNFVEGVSPRKWKSIPCGNCQSELSPRKKISCKVYSAKTEIYSP